MLSSRPVPLHKAFSWLKLISLPPHSSSICLPKNLTHLLYLWACLALPLKSKLLADRWPCLNTLPKQSRLQELFVPSHAIRFVSLWSWYNTSYTAGAKWNGTKSCPQVHPHPWTDHSSLASMLKRILFAETESRFERTFRRHGGYPLTMHLSRACWEGFSLTSKPS